MLGPDPLYVANEGLFVAIVDHTIADEFANQLRKTTHSKTASVIGEIVIKHKKQVILNSNIGGRRVVNMLAGEQMPRIC